ncbi:hypothetical protein FOZ61_011028 [Perkinsus olseni]|uniref:Uncharacterized protein n=1 Tax=Perkinsus olseni TaxID=32597 RepID=A0A7J6M169_PEROL|nr:hypothetical protein FOZ61_011028 [Perkinsus olseni]
MPFTCGRIRHRLRWWYSEGTVGMDHCELALNVFFLCLLIAFIAHVIANLLPTIRVALDTTLEASKLLGIAEGLLWIIPGCLTFTLGLCGIAVIMCGLTVGVLFMSRRDERGSTNDDEAVAGGPGRRVMRDHPPRTVDRKKRKSKSHRKADRHRACRRRASSKGRCRLSCLSCRFDDICDYMQPRGTWVSVLWLRARLDSLGSQALDHMLSVGWLEITPCGKYCRAYPDGSQPQERASPPPPPTPDHGVPTFNLARDDSESCVHDWDIDSCNELLDDEGAAPPPLLQEDACGPSSRHDEDSSESSWEASCFHDVPTTTAGAEKRLLLLSLLYSASERVDWSNVDRTRGRTNSSLCSARRYAAAPRSHRASRATMGPMEWVRLSSWSSHYRFANTLDIFQLCDPTGKVMGHYDRGVSALLRTTLKLGDNNTVPCGLILMYETQEHATNEFSRLQMRTMTESYADEWLNELQPGEGEEALPGVILTVHHYDPQVTHPSQYEIERRDGISKLVCVVRALHVKYFWPREASEGQVIQLPPGQTLGTSDDYNIVTDLQTWESGEKFREMPQQDSEDPEDFFRVLPWVKDRTKSDFVRATYAYVKRDDAGEITSVLAAVSVTGDVDTKRPARLVMSSPYVDTESVSPEEAEQALDAVLQHVFAKHRRSVGVVLYDSKDTFYEFAEEYMLPRHRYWTEKEAGICLTAVPVQMPVPAQECLLHSPYVIPAEFLSFETYFKTPTG